MCLLFQAHQCPGSSVRVQARSSATCLNSSFSPPGKDGSLDRSVLCPFFMVRKTEEEANCVISPMFGNGEDNSAVKISLMINQRALSAGESLLLFLPKPTIVREVQATTRDFLC